MPLTEEQLALITAFRKETEDLIHANLKMAFKIKSGEKVLAVGNNAISFPVGYSEQDYSSPEEYLVRFVSAVDSNGVDITDAISVESKTTAGFTVYSPRVGTLVWKTHVLVPDPPYHT